MIGVPLGSPGVVGRGNGNLTCVYMPEIGATVVTAMVSHRDIAKKVRFFEWDGRIINLTDNNQTLGNFFIDVTPMPQDASNYRSSMAANVLGTRSLFDGKGAGHILYSTGFLFYISLNGEIKSGDEIGLPSRVKYTSPDNLSVESMNSAEDLTQFPAVVCAYANSQKGQEVLNKNPLVRQLVQTLTTQIRNQKLDIWDRLTILNVVAGIIHAIVTLDFLKVFR